jgi:hypothetical protein
MQDLRIAVLKRKHPPTGLSESLGGGETAHLISHHTQLLRPAIRS